MNSKATHKKRTTRSELGPVADESVAKTTKISRSETTAEPLSPSRDGSRRGGRPAAIATPTKAAEGQKRETLQDEKNEEKRASPPPKSAWTCEDCKEVFALELRLKRHQSTRIEDVECGGVSSCGRGARGVHGRGGLGREA